jgi:YesN/AraC family two-component response regulator
MNKVLIVEDEKMIRKGIVAMLNRAPIPINEMIECRNGEEALEILQQTKIDLMITDIRMPKMDGITLVKQLQDLPDKPAVLVVSGYDEFNYAVEALRNGVKDYLLKPIEREKFYKVIMSIQEELENKEEEHVISKKIGSQQLKYLLLNKGISDEEIKAIEKQFCNMFPGNTYLICCLKDKGCFLREDASLIVLREVEGQTLLILDGEQLKLRMAEELKDYGMGISKAHTGIGELKEAYLEALFARREAFVKCLPFYHYEDVVFEYETIPEDFPEQFIQLFGTHKVEDGIKKFNGIRVKAKMNKISAETLLEVTRRILNQLISTYERMIEFELEAVQELREPLDYINADIYYDYLENWIRKMQQLIMEEFDDYKNKEKIMQAVLYIKENFKSDLNMAVVSNCISMNYSLFSLNFKQYTGMNFVNYLKKIRVDEAKRLLEETDEKIIDISRMVGYENDKHFMKIFKSVCGVSPSEYRKNSWYQKIEK